MASRFPPGNRTQLRPRKGHDMKWSCDKHAEPIAFNCKKHNISICHRCATKDHGHKPCKLDDIEDVILKRMKRLDDKRQEIQQKKKHIQTLDSKIESIATFSSNHLQTVKDEVKSTHRDKSKSVNDDEEKKIRLINEEADEKIRIINEKRDGRIKACKADIERQQLIIQKSQAKLFSEAKAISKVVSKTITDLKSKNQLAIGTLDNMDDKIKRIIQDDKTLVNEALQLLASFDDNFNLSFHQDVSECLDRIQHEVKKVKLFQGIVGGEHYGRIDGYIGKCELVKALHIPSTFNKHRVRGLISDDEICVWEINNSDTYVNISTEHTQKVTVGDGILYITSCASLDSNVIVWDKFGKECTGVSLDGGITLYDRQRKAVLPKNSDCGSMYVDVDMDGMMLTAQYDQPNIYVINPADCKIVNTITMQGKLVRGEIQALSSGDIVVKTGNDTFTVISRSGEEKAVIHYGEWCAPRCRVDKLTDTLSITYWDTERNIFAVDQVSCDGIIQAKRIVEYDKSDRCSYTSPCFVTPSGNLVACNGDTFFMYKKRFMV